LQRFAPAFPRPPSGSLPIAGQPLRALQGFQLRPVCPARQDHTCKLVVVPPAPTLSHFFEILCPERNQLLIFSG
jgi:hypothetical protein